MKGEFVMEDAKKILMAVITFLDIFLHTQTTSSHLLK